ncbi:hypothetical protein [Ekhidna sp. To15]|uniref:hypothetical protein n=1 Tax=Ekhidna sp. To15 TaxID=3395267 RepID=UPI003F524DB3
MMRGKGLLFSLMFVLVALISSAQNGSANYHQVKITSSNIAIHGKTNINKFQCKMVQPALNDSIVVSNIWSNQKLEFKGLILKYRVDQFECGIGAMNNDFQELLKADEEPHLYLQLNSISLRPNNNAFEELDVDAEVEILLAGVRKKVMISGGKVLNHSSAQLTLKGDKALLITDFNIEPPTKMFGMIKVTDDISIQFEISMKVSAF